MAISKEQLTVEVVLDSSGAVKGIKDLQGQFLDFDQVMKSATKTSKQAGSVTENMGQLFDGLAQSVSRAAIPLLGIQSALALVTQAFNAVSGAVGSFVNEFAQAERAQILLNQSIESAAPRILNTADAWSAYLDQLERTKNVDADVLKGLVSQAVQMGFSEKQIKSLIDATVGLSKVTGQDLGSSFQQLIGTTRGMARSLQVMFTDVANLSEEQLRSGAAFDVVAEKTKNAASAAGSFSASTKALGFVLGGVREDIGRIIVESLNLKGGADALTATFYRVRDAFASLNLDELGQKFSVLVEALRPIITVGAGVAAVYGVILAASSPLVVTTTLLAAKFLAIAAAAVGTVVLFEQIALNASLMKEALVIAANTIGLGFLKMFDLVVTGFQKLFSLFGDNALAKAAEDISKGIQRSMNNLSANISSNFETIKKSYDTGFSGEAIKQGINFVKAFNGEVLKTDQSLNKLGQTGARVKVVDEQALQKAAAILKDVQSMTERLRGETASMNADEKRQIDLKLDAQMRVIDAREKELQALGKLNAAQRSALADARIAAAEQANAARQALASKDITQQQAEAMKQLESLTSNTVSLEQQNALSKLEGLDLIRAQYEIERQKIDAIEQQLALTGKLGEEQQKQIARARAAVSAGEGVAAGKSQSEEAKKSADTYIGVINSAASGADAIVQNAITQIGNAFGPKGQIIAAIVNVLRMGGEQMKNLGKSLVDIIANLPLNIVEGLIGLIEGLVEGFIKLMSDPAKIARIVTAFTTIVPKVITALAKALPEVLKVLLDPAFWVELAKQIVRSIFEALKQMVYAIGDFIASIFSGDVFDPLGDSITDMGNSIGDGIRDATKAVTGFTEQLFGVQEDVAGQGEKDGTGAAIKRAFDYGAKKTKSVWKEIVGLLKDIFKIIAAPFEFAWTALKAAGELFINVLGTFMSLFGTAGQILLATFETAGNIFKTVFNTIWDSGRIVFEGIGRLLGSVWDTFKNVGQAVFNFGRSIFNGVIDSFRAVFTFFKTLFDDPVKAFKQFIEDMKNIFGNIWDAFKEIPIKLWEGIKDAAKIIWDTFKDLGKRIWEGLLSVGADIIAWFKHIGRMIWEGLASALNDIFAAFRKAGETIWQGLKAGLDSIGEGAKNIFYKAGDWLAGAFGWSEGGIVPGVAMAAGDSLKNDTIPALLSPGEAVIPRSLMSNPQIDNFIRQILDDRKMPITNEITVPRVAMANGGIVGAVSGGGTSFGDTNVNVVLKIDTKEPLDESFIRQRLVPALKAELKASSLRGDFVLSAKGVRG